MNLNVIAVQANSNRNVKSRSPVTRGAGFFLALYLIRLVSSPAQTRAAVPADAALQSIHCTTWQCILDEFPVIPELLEAWFTSYKGAGITTSAGWAGTTVTLTLIRESEVTAYGDQ